VTGFRVRRAVLFAVLLFVALCVQLVILAPLHLPGATPDLVYLVVAAFALVHGPTTGALAGFAAGLALDIAPPANGVVGLWAVVFCVVGYVLGLLRDDAEQSAVMLLIVVALGSAVIVLGYAGLSATFGDAPASWGLVVKALLGEVAYTLLLTPFVIPLVSRLAKRVEPVGVKR
jgi:rod shape-determining protein MreD